MKKDLGPVNALYPSLTTIVGAVVNGRPNFLAVAHVGIFNHGQPQYLSFGISKKHYTNAGIKEHGQFSVNIPGRALLAETDYVGIVTGKNTDKSSLFELFPGQLEHAPLIKACPVNMECALHSVLDFDTHEIFVGSIVKTWADPNVVTPKGGVDPAKADPLLFDMATVAYYGLGPKLGDCWSAGKAVKAERKG